MPTRNSRTSLYRDKAPAYAAAQHDGTLDLCLDPARLVFLIIGLAACWHAAPKVDPKC